MKQQKLRYSTLVLLVAVTAGCASYRTSSNVATDSPPTAAAARPVLIAEDALPTRKYKEIGPIEVSIKKLTVFHKDPTKELANEALTEKARVINADAVINVTYKSGVGFTTWGYMDAKGTGVKLAD